MARSLEGRNAIITGGSRGLGFSIAQGYVLAGANIFITGRDETFLKKAERDLGKFCSNGQKVKAYVMDVSNPMEIKQTIKEAISNLGSIEILINNAGLHGGTGPLELISDDEWCLAINVNLMGSVLMCKGLIEHFKENKYGKIIQISGGGATGPMPFFSAYAASKAGVVRFIETIAEEYKEFSIYANSVSPGALNTRLTDEVLEAGPNTVGVKYYKKMQGVKSEGGAPIEKAVSLAVFLGSSNSDGISGKLISAHWDKWDKFIDNKQDLMGSDIFTLRRIIAKDRGFDWGDV